jgi:hypothetical protein
MMRFNPSGEDGEDPPDHAPRWRKDTRRWCKGRPGQEHSPEARYALPYGEEGDGCGPSQGWQARYGPWRCGHEMWCSRCGKVLTQHWSMKKEDCPRWQKTHRPVPGQGQSRTSAG